MKLFHYLKYTCLVSGLVFSKLGFAFDYRILVLPSGGATGIIPATVLVELELQTGKPVHSHFHEIWSSSIGSMIASQLTAPSQDEYAVPKTALEVQQFLEKVFSSYWRASGILKEFKSSIPSETELKDTIIPVRILSAEIKSWWCGGYVPIPSKTEFKSFSQQESGNLSLSSLACGSCVVPPVNWYEPVKLENGETSYIIDAGHEFCSAQCMNPLFEMMKEFSKNINLEQDTVSLFFLSNGWVRMHPSWGSEGWVDMPGADGTNVRVHLFNVDIDLKPALEEWKRETWHGSLLGRVDHEYTLLNLAGIGAVPSQILKKQSENVLKDSIVFNSMIQKLAQEKDGH
jgi:hypothetical protein